MKKHARTALGLVFCSVFLAFAFPAPTFASSPLGACVSGSTGASDCQYRVVSPLGGYYTQAPALGVSTGIRLDAGVTNILFNNWPGIGPRFVTNSSGKDIFVPQAKQAEFQSFLDRAPAIGVAVNYAVAPYFDSVKGVPYYTASPSVLAVCGPWTPNQISAAVPAVANSASPVIVNSYTMMPASLATQTTSIGSTAQGASALQYVYVRQANAGPGGGQDCSNDDEGHSVCTPVAFMQDQSVGFQSVGSANAGYTWNPQTPVAKLYVSLNGGGYNLVATNDCTKSYPPAINGTCGSANGLNYTVQPSANLCATGNASPVTPNGTNSWGWTCDGMGANATNQNCATSVNCPLPWGGSIGVGRTVTAYQTATVPYSDTCQSETRTCTNGTLSGSYTYQNCKPGCAGGSTNWTNGTNTCTGSYGAMNAGDTATVTNTPSNTTGTETATCANDGSGNVTFSDATCTASAADCPQGASGDEFVYFCDAALPASVNGTRCTVRCICDYKSEAVTYICTNGEWKYGNYSSGFCFLGDVTVTLADGSTKPMTELKQGDVVRGKKHDNTVLAVPNHVNAGTIYGFNGGKPFVTGGHPFWTKDGWKAIDPSLTLADDERHGVKAAKLQIGDKLWLSNGKRLEITSIDAHDADPSQVFNPVVSGDHTYYANGILVHNKPMHKASCPDLGPVVSCH